MPAERKLKGQMGGGGLPSGRTVLGSKVGWLETKMSQWAGKDRKEGFLEAKGNELGKSDPKMEREKQGIGEGLSVLGPGSRSDSHRLSPGSERGRYGKVPRIEEMRTEPPPVEE